jgi:hypothetical protein
MCPHAHRLANPHVLGKFVEECPEDDWKQEEWRGSAKAPQRLNREGKKLFEKSKAKL